MVAAGRGLVQVLEYSDVSRPAARPEALAVAGVPEAEVERRVLAACARERAAVEGRLRAEAAEREGQLRAEMGRQVEERVGETLRAFLAERTGYFARVEIEVVELSLAISRKILGREAALDPMLLAGLVRVALDGMQRGAAVRLRVPPAAAEDWRARLGAMGLAVEAEVVSDATCGEECVLETAGGTARLSWEGQLKEVEQGFRDLLGQRPDAPAVWGPV